MTACCVCKTATAVVSIRMIPRRDAEPLSDEIRRALVWPGVASPCLVLVCGQADHLRQVKDAAICVLGVTPLSDAVVSIVFKDEEAAS